MCSIFCDRYFFRTGKIGKTMANRPDFRNASRQSPSFCPHVTVQECCSASFCTPSFWQCWHCLWFQKCEDSTESIFSAALAFPVLHNRQSSLRPAMYKRMVNQTLVQQTFRQQCRLKQRKKNLLFQRTTRAFPPVR